MNLQHAFQSARNLGDLAGSWSKYLQALIKDRNITSSIKFSSGDTASLIAPAALVAHLLRLAEINLVGRHARVLILGGDGMARLDRGMWVRYAGAFLGAEGMVEIMQTLDENPQTTLNPVGEALGLEPAAIITHDEIAAGDYPTLDMAVWIHPAVEAGDYETQTLASASRLLAAGVPVFACAYNELDLHIQNHVLAAEGVRLELVGGPLARGSSSVNCFGISSSGLGVQGGWGAVLCKLVPSEAEVAPASLHAILAATAMMRAEGATSCQWEFGARVNGVAFNRVLPIGLLGNLAVDEATGYVLKEQDKPRILNVIGHIWEAMRKALPRDKYDLVAWAAKTKLAFNGHLPKELKRRDEVIAALRSAYENGVLDAGIGLARGYESLGTDDARQKAFALYREIGDRHPLSAYALGHEAAAAGELAEAERMLIASANFGYPPAITDVGKLLFTLKQPAKGLAAIRRAASMGDAEGNYLLAESQLEQGQYVETLATLRKAWSVGHTQALDLAYRMCQGMLAKGIGKRSSVKRELADIESFQKKLGIYEEQVRMANG